MTSREEIEALRKLYGPTPVRISHVPGWFKQKMRLWLRLHDKVKGPICFVIEEFRIATGWNVDHYGSSGDAFVNEPYGEAREMNAKIAEMLNCDFVESDNSYWFPGYTKRYEFRRRF